MMPHQVDNWHRSAPFCLSCQSWHDHPMPPNRLGRHGLVASHLTAHVSSISPVYNPNNAAQTNAGCDGLPGDISSSRLNWTPACNFRSWQRSWSNSHTLIVWVMHFVGSKVVGIISGIDFALKPGALSLDFKGYRKSCHFSGGIVATRWKVDNPHTKEANPNPFYSYCAIVPL